MCYSSSSNRSQQPEAVQFRVMTVLGELANLPRRKDLMVDEGILPCIMQLLEFPSVDEVKQTFYNTAAQIAFILSQVTFTHASLVWFFVQVISMAAAALWALAIKNPRVHRFARSNNIVEVSVCVRVFARWSYSHPFFRYSCGGVMMLPSWTPLQGLLSVVF
jgi:hypothetical protein